MTRLVRVVVGPERMSLRVRLLAVEILGTVSVCTAIVAADLLREVRS